MYKKNIKYMVEFDFYGKCSIRYAKEISVEMSVYTNLQRFLNNKSDDEYAFDRINVSLVAFLDFINFQLH